MAETMSAKHDQPVTADEVAAWFPHTRFGTPDIAKCAVLARAVERTRSTFRILEADDYVVAAAKALPAVTKAARLLKQELGLLTKKAGPHGNSWEIVKLATALRDLDGAIEDFLGAAPGRSIGRQESVWLASANKWAPLAAQCLAKKGRQDASQITPTGPVMAVLCQAVDRVYGKNLTRPVLSRRLQEHRRRKLKKKPRGN